MGKKGKVGIVIIGLILVVAAGFTVFQLKKEGKIPERASKYVISTENRYGQGLKEGQLTDLRSNKTGVRAGKDTELILTVRAVLKEDDEIELLQDDKMVAIMHDDGEKGDIKAGDNLYTAAVTVHGDKHGDAFLFRAKNGKKKTDEIQVSVYDEVKKDDLATIKDIGSELAKVEDSHRVDGVVPKDDYKKTIEDLYQTADKLIEQNGILVKELKKTEHGITILYENGVPYSYTIQDPASKAAGPAGMLLMAKLEPYRNDPEMSLPAYDGYAEQLLSVNTVEYQYWLDDQDVTMENILAAFQPNSLILWDGHGDETDWGSCLVTGTYVDVEGTEQCDDYLEGRIAIADEGRLALLPRWFETYLGDISGSFIYLGACYSAKDWSLPSVFCDKGAAVVLGYSDSVLVSYDSNILDAVTLYMTSLNEDTGLLFSAIEAFDNAVALYGESDDDDTPAYFMLYGDFDFRLDDSWNRMYIPLEPLVFPEHTRDEAEAIEEEPELVEEETEIIEEEPEYVEEEPVVEEPEVEEPEVAPEEPETVEEEPKVIEESKEKLEDIQTDAEEKANSLKERAEEITNGIAQKVSDMVSNAIQAIDDWLTHQMNVLLEKTCNSTCHC